MSIHKLHFVLQLADNALVLGHRISEWCGHGPILEQDIALTNTALDHIGQSRSLFQYAADIYNGLSEADKQAAFVNFSLEAGKQAEEDTFPYLRDAWDFKNVLLVEHPNGDWASTVARSFFYDTFMCLLYKALSASKDETIAAIAQKSLKEVLYHKKWSSEWVIRLGDGTEESHKRMQQAVDELWPYTGEMFVPSEAELEMVNEGIHTNPADLKTAWVAEVKAILDEATLNCPDPDAWMHLGGKKGTHTEQLGYILAELQYVQRAYPNMSW